MNFGSTHNTNDYSGPKTGSRKTGHKSLVDVPQFRGSKFYYFHVNGSIGIVQKIEFEIKPDFGCTTFKTSRKVVLDNPSVSVCFAVAFTANSLERKGEPIELKL